MIQIPPNGINRITVKCRGEQYSRTFDPPIKDADVYEAERAQLVQDAHDDRLEPDATESFKARALRKGAP